jgi:hypothetical protein
VTVTAPAALNSPLSIPLTLNLRDTVTASWSTPAPAQVASGQAFPLALTVTGNVQQISGAVMACPSTVPVEQCFGSFPFQVTPSAFFSGAPGTFAFTVQGSDCQGPQDFYLVARLDLTFTDGSFLGPFFSPLTTTTVQAPTGPLLQGPSKPLTVNAFAGLNPPPHTLELTSACGEVLNFSATADVPWLSVLPPTGTVPVFGQQVAVDVTGLTAAQSPFAATVTVTAPAALNSPLRIPLTLNLLGP